MKTIFRGAIAFVLVLFPAQLIHGQDLSKYRNFAFGTSTAVVTKQVGLDARELVTVHQLPALIQELTWYPPQPFDSSRPAEPVEQILFSFDNGALYRILVTYDSSAIKGLTDEDMIQTISAKYGVATRPVADIDFPTNPSYEAKVKVIARWENANYSLNLIRPPGSNTFATVMLDKRLDSQAGISIAESVRLELLEAPQKEAARLKHEANDLEQERQKNLTALRP
jgi:hypothetical protein